jgi:molecular chaperone GrpE
MRRVKQAEKSNEIKNLKIQLARALADYDNLRKRSEEEREVWIKFASKNIVAKLISVLDNLDSAQKHLNDQDLAIAIAEFRKVLNEEELEEIAPEKGSKFDPGYHEAIEKVDGGKHGEVAETVLKGWRFRDGMLVRAAKVKVYGESEGKEEDLEGKN